MTTNKYNIVLVSYFSYPFQKFGLSSIAEKANKTNIICSNHYITHVCWECNV